MTPDQLESLLALTEERHFGRAAARLGISTAALSRRIKALETELGSPIFTRTSRDVRTTRLGEALVAPARTVLQALDSFTNVVADHREGRAGTFTAAYCGGVGMLVAAFARQLRAQHPDLQLHLIRGTSIEVNEAVTEGRAALGVTRIWPHGLAATALAPLPGDTVLMPIDHPLAVLDTIQAVDLEGQTVLLATHRSWSRHDGPEETWRPLGVTVITRDVEVHSDDDFLNLVAAGLGISVVPRHMFEGDPRSDLVGRPLEPRAVLPAAPVFVAWRHEDADRLIDEAAGMLGRAAAEWSRRAGQCPEPAAQMNGKSVSTSLPLV